jgi:hypothetical protein
MDPFNKECIKDGLSANLGPGLTLNRILTVLDKV